MGKTIATIFVIGIMELTILQCGAGKSAENIKNESDRAQGDDSDADTSGNDARDGLKLVSDAFLDGDEIPDRYTCEGDDISPPLKWSGVGSGVESFVLIVDDPDAPDPENPKMTWVHWVLYNIPASRRFLEESIQNMPEGTGRGLNDWKKNEYGGPCPPVGRHRYFHKLYALDTRLEGLTNPTKSEVEAAMEGHILEQAQLIGMYEKKQK